ncbi:MAG: chemotaxis protein CheW [Steroidobacteraceae bacterium]|nr:chemotaxis protein CheW [Steroidobacteraceae bacterium]MDW8259534.1 chemotaxis protein CheW [Gammaproteobacteria bacterium]
MAERVTEIYSLLMPLAEGRLLVPRACIAEVIAYTTPSEMAGAPPWYLGTVSWSGRNVPLAAFEGFCGQPIPPVTTRTRVVVFHCLGDRLEVGNFALVSQGFPQLVRVSADVLRPDPLRVIADRVPALCGVRMMNEAPLIPDLERIESLIADETRSDAA